MSKSINVDQLQDAITKALSEYAQTVKKATNDEILQAAKDLKQDIKTRSAVSFGGKKKGYASGWAYKKTSSKGANQVSYIVYNKKHYQLTHLLEYGHVKWLWGKKTDQFVQGRAHIRPAEAEMEKKLLNNIKNRLSQK